jgi:hypothetical protein
MIFHFAGRHLIKKLFGTRNFSVYSLPPHGGQLRGIKIISLTLWQIGLNMIGF